MKTLKTWEEVKQTEKVSFWVSLFFWACAIFWGFLSIFDQTFLALEILAVGGALAAAMQLKYCHFLYRFYLKEPIMGEGD